MADCMSFPETPLEFLKSCEFKDEKNIYTNGSMLIPTFRVEQMIEHYFNSTSTADVQEVRHSKWIYDGSDIGWANYKCSSCGECFVLEAGTPQENEYNFCPHCGEKMDKE